MTQRVLDLAEPPLAGLRERLLVLRALSSFAAVDDEALTMLAEHARYRTFRKGEVIGRPDRIPTAIQIVLEGRVMVTRDGHTVFDARSGDGLFVLPVIAGLPSGEATATTTTRTLEIPAPAFMAALEDNFSLLRNELRLLALSATTAHGVLPVTQPASVLGGGTPEYPVRSLTVVERVMRLQQGAFGVMSVDALAEFARTMTELRLREGDLIWAVGETSSYTLHIHHGRARCTAPDGGNVEISGPTMIGELDAWAQRSRTYEARAATDMVAWRVSLEDVLMVLESHVPPAIQMLATVARGLLSDPARVEIALGAHRESEPRESEP